MGIDKKITKIKIQIQKQGKPSKNMGIEIQNTKPRENIKQEYLDAWKHATSMRTK